MARTRDMVVSDAARAATIHVAAKQATYRRIMTDAFLDGLDVAGRQRQWAAQLAEGPPEGASWLVVEDDDGLVAGICAVGPARDDEGELTGEGELYMINLDPAHWGLGLGRLLLEAAVERLRRGGFSQLVLWMAAGNARAGAFYERNGWALDGARKDAPIGGATVTEVRYRRSVSV